MYAYSKSIWLFDIKGWFYAGIKLIFALFLPKVALLIKMLAIAKKHKHWETIAAAYIFAINLFPIPTK